MSDANFYVTTTPQFSQVKMQVKIYGRTQGGTPNISAPGASMNDRYIASAKVNGKASNKV